MFEPFLSENRNQASFEMEFRYDCDLWLSCAETGNNFLRKVAREKIKQRLLGKEKRQNVISPKQKGIEVEWTLSLWLQHAEERRGKQGLCEEGARAFIETRSQNFGWSITQLCGLSRVILSEIGAVSNWTENQIGIWAVGTRTRGSLAPFIMKLKKMERMCREVWRSCQQVWQWAGSVNSVKITGWKWADVIGKGLVENAAPSTVRVSASCDRHFSQKYLLKRQKQYLEPEDEQTDKRQDC